MTDDCTTCDGAGRIDDPSACGDPDHCAPTVPCPTCNPNGEDRD